MSEENEKPDEGEETSKPGPAGSLEGGEPDLRAAGSPPMRRYTDAPRARRGLVKALAVLYGVSLLAAAVILVRQSRTANGNSSDAKEGKSALAVSKVLLPSSSKDYVAVITISGPIYQSDDGRMWGRGMRYWRKKIIKTAKKDQVKAVVLAINSPGGSVGAVQELHGTILRMREKYKKPFVAQFGDVSASGGYYLAAACDKIVAHPGTLLGSIGVIFSHSNVEGLFGKLGIKSKPIKSGKMKDIGSSTRPMTKEEEGLLQGLIDNAYEQFLQAVVAGRGLPEEHVRPLADGRIFTGEQGKENGLVDELGGYYEAVMLAGKLGGIKGTPKVLKESESLSDVLDLLDSKLSMTMNPQAVLLSEMSRFTFSGLEYRWDR